MKKTRLAALVLALAATLWAAGCGRRGGGDIIVSEEPGFSAKTGETEAAIPPGTEFTVLRAGREYVRGESLSRAEQLRDLEMRENLSVAVRTEVTADDAETTERYLASAAAGEARYDLVVGTLGEVGYPLLCAGGPAGEWPELEYSVFPESLAAAGRRRLAAGAIAPGSYGDVSCVLMSREAAREFSVTLPLRDGGWTFDDMVAAASAIPSGTGLYRYAVTDGGAGIAWIRAAGVRLTEEAGGRRFVCGELSAAAKEALRRAAGIMSDGKQTRLEPSAAPEGAFDRETVDGEGAIPTFTEGRALFLFCRTADAMALREAGAEFLILPYPALGSAPAAGYADSLSGEVAAVTASEADPVRRRLIGEYDGLSGKYVEAERVDALLAGRSAYDGESRETLEALLRGAQYELCEACGAGGLAAALDRALADPAGEAPEDFAARAAAINVKLKEVY